MLTSEQKSFFHANGNLVVPALVAPEKLALGGPNTSPNPRRAYIVTYAGL